MNARRQRSRPIQMLVALLYGASAGHAAFVVGLLWLRPELNAGAVASLLVLPFFYVLLAFVPVVLLLVLLRIGLGIVAPGFTESSLLSTLLLSLVGLGAAVGISYMLLGWLPRDTEIFQSILLGAAIGGVVSGFMVSRKGMLGEGTKGGRVKW